MAIKKHGVIIETPTEARQAEEFYTVASTANAPSSNKWKLHCHSTGASLRRVSIATRSSYLNGFLSTGRPEYPSLEP
jgi:hypothetical protein